MILDNTKWKVTQNILNYFYQKEMNDIELTKLDIYDYTIQPGIISIQLDRGNDPTMVDILSEISNTQGRIFVDGRYFMYLDHYRVYNIGDIWYMDLGVFEFDKGENM